MRQAPEKRREFARTRENSLNSKRVAAVVLAAGDSSRLGQPKQLLPIDGQALIRRTVKTVLSSSVDEVIVTTGAVDLSAALHGLAWTRAEVSNPQLGQSQSVRAGLNAVEQLGDFDAILFTPCDLPLLSTKHLNALLAKYRDGNWPIVASRYAEILGAPLVLSRELWPELHLLRGDVGARKILVSHPRTTRFVDWQNGKFDLDTPEDVEAFARASSTKPDS